MSDSSATAFSGSLCPRAPLSLRKARSKQALLRTYHNVAKYLLQNHAADDVISDTDPTFTRYTKSPLGCRHNARENWLSKCLVVHKSTMIIFRKKFSSRKYTGSSVIVGHHKWVRMQQQTCTSWLITQRHCKRNGRRLTNNLRKDSHICEVYRTNVVSGGILQVR